jgi:hypothetical protein
MQFVRNPLKAERSSKRCPLPWRAATTDFISEHSVFTLGLSQSSAAAGSLQIRTFYNGYDVTQAISFHKNLLKKGKNIKLSLPTLCRPAGGTEACLPAPILIHHTGSR